MPYVFAYGSNMDWDQMRKRCPSAKYLSIAKLPDHRLAFTRKSLGRKCGVASVVYLKGSAVWGVVYKITDTDLKVLDRYEGFLPANAPKSSAYERNRVVVFQYGEPDHPLEVELYIAIAQVFPPLPSQEYKDLILQGARAWNLPRQYIAELERIEVG